MIAVLSGLLLHNSHNSWGRFLVRQLWN